MINKSVLVMKFISEYKISLFSSYKKAKNSRYSIF